MIDIRGLHKFFHRGQQNEIHVIDDVTLHFPEKGMVAIFGKSGCGKTTLLNVIGGLDTYLSGSLLVDGQEIGTDTDMIRNAYMGYIFQNYNLIASDTCFDNVANALRLCGVVDEAIIESRVMAALSSVGMEMYRNRTPDTLSGGQQQRIAIARAIVKNPRIILADEPTGNLDEANTVMIMDLLKAISQDHLVLLVTHEANLVDYYCDSVIELSDGKVVGIQNKTDATGYVARDKNDIYLGELQKHTQSDTHIDLTYYGELPPQPIHLTVVSYGGHTYLKINSDKVQIIDESSEVTLREGTFEAHAQNKSQTKHIDMLALPPIKATKCGKLFTLASAIKSGYTANFTKQKKSKKMLKACLGLFAAVLVAMSATFGTVFRDMKTLSDAYNHNVFYLWTPTADILSTLKEGMNKAETGIDFISLTEMSPTQDEKTSLISPSFETFSSPLYYIDESFQTNAVYFDIDMAKDKTLVVGKKDNLATNEMVISTQVADALLEGATYDYITTYQDLLGIFSHPIIGAGRGIYIAGVVETDEPAVYLHPFTLAQKRMGGLAGLDVDSAERFGQEVAKGETIFLVYDHSSEADYPKAGETIMLQGESFTVKKVVFRPKSYSDWLATQGIEKMDTVTYFEAKLAEEQPELSKENDKMAYEAALVDIKNRYIFDYYDVYYDQIEAFLSDFALFGTDFDVWLATEKKVLAAIINYCGGDAYYIALQYKEEHGTYPTLDEIEGLAHEYESVIDGLNRAYERYGEEYHNNVSYMAATYVNVYLVHESDYIALSNCLGETHPSAAHEDQYYYETEPMPLAEDVKPSAPPTSMTYSQLYRYTIIHSNNPDATKAYLSATFGQLTHPFSDHKAIVTPSDVRESLMTVTETDLVSKAITIVVLLVLMGMCMYFIMRATLLSRIKGIGIYRAIGVSKRNLLFRFAVENLVLTTLTVFVGFLLTSIFTRLCLSMSPLMTQIFYYPLWLCLCDLVLLYAMSLLIGLLPVFKLLRKTPSEIMAKYDI